MVGNYIQESGEYIHVNLSTEVLEARIIILNDVVIEKSRLTVSFLEPLRFKKVPF